MSEITMVPVAQIDPHPHNPRRDLGDLTELARSIKAHGIRQGLLLVPAGDRYQLVIGHRRHAAAKKAGLTSVPAVIDPTLSEADQIELMLLENIQRSDLSPIEEAEGYQQLLDLDVPVATIAKKTGRSAKTVTARIKLLGLPETARAKLHSGQATLLDAAKLDAFDPAVQEKLAEHLGQPSFGVEVSYARRRASDAATRADVITELEHKGVTLWDGGDRGVHILRIDKLSDLTGWEHPFPDGSTYEPSSYSTAVWVYGPWVEPDERTVEARRARDEERRLQAEAADRLRALEAAVGEARDEWVRGYVARKVSAAHAKLIVSHLGLQAALIPASWYLAKWLGVDNRQSAEHLAAAAEVAGLGRMDPVCWLLISCHSYVVHQYAIGSYGYLLDLLVALGYQPSGDELDLVYGGGLAEDDQ